MFMTSEHTHRTVKCYLSHMLHKYYSGRVLLGQIMFMMLISFIQIIIFNFSKKLRERPPPDGPSAGPPRISPLFLTSPATIFFLFSHSWGSSR